MNHAPECERAPTIGLPRYTNAMAGFSQLLASLDPVETGRGLHRQVFDLYPICRSITGDGLRQTLAWIRQQIPLQIHEVPTGTGVLDWTVPREWNIRDAYIKDAAGDRIVDFQRLNLHVVNYSSPVKARMSLEDLRPHLFSLPDRPDWVPYRTTYYNESWGFCLSHRQLTRLSEGEYEVCIDSTLSAGHLSYGECLLRGDTPDEVLISTHVCHPSLANDNLSGLVVAVRLASILRHASKRYTYRFLFVPGTIGSISWLAGNGDAMKRIKHGLVLAGVGDSGPVTYKRSRRGTAEIDMAVEHVLEQSGDAHQIRDFEPYGYDERQYCSPGFNLPVGNLSRTPFGSYPEYHTSADNPDFVKPESLFDSLAKCHTVLSVLEGNQRYLNLSPRGEPQLGRRGLYGSIGGATDKQTLQMAMLWVLNASDGSSSLLDVARQAKLPFAVIQSAAEALVAAQLLRALPPE